MTMTSVESRFASYDEPPADAELIDRFQDHDDAAFGELYRRHFDDIVGYLQFKGAQAELASDIAQDTFIGAMGALRDGRYEERGKLRSWLCTCAIRRLLTEFRRNQKHPTADSVDLFDNDRIAQLPAPEDQIDPEEALWTAEVFPQLENIVGADRMDVIARIYDGDTNTEIAEDTGIGRMTVGSRLSKGRTAIKNSGIVETLFA